MGVLVLQGAAQIGAEGLPGLRHPEVERLQEDAAKVPAVHRLPKGQRSGKAIAPEGAELFIPCLVQRFALLRRQLQQGRSIDLIPYFIILHGSSVLPVLAHPDQLTEHLFCGLAVPHGAHQPGQLVQCRHFVTPPTSSSVWVASAQLSAVSVTTGMLLEP